VLSYTLDGCKVFFSKFSHHLVLLMAALAVS
jgi:hypothetical protein